MHTFWAIWLVESHVVWSKQLYTVYKRSEAFLQFRLLKSDTKLEIRAWAYVFLVFATCRRNPRNRLWTIVRSGEQNRQAKL